MKKYLSLTFGFLHWWLLNLFLGLLLCLLLGLLLWLGGLLRLVFLLPLALNQKLTGLLLFLLAADQKKVLGIVLR